MDDWTILMGDWSDAYEGGEGDLARLWFPAFGPQHWFFSFILAAHRSAQTVESAAWQFNGQPT